MKYKIVTLCSASIVILLAATLASGPMRQPSSTTTGHHAITIPLNADTIFTLVNAERTKKGLQPLIRDARLDQTAQARADDMVARNYFSHFDPVDGHKMINDQKPGCTGMSENIGMTNGYVNDNDTQLYGSGGWMNSKPHREAILRTDYTLTGVAVNGNKVVQHFCIAK
jgi:uncharacterized protein YkwD